ncbi:NAD-dependent epimerase/dehydratase family protein [Paenibacillus sp. Marseille-Q7038]
MGKIIVLGSGYLGVNIANYFYEQGYDVNVVGRHCFYTELLKDSISFIEANIILPQTLVDIISKGDIVFYAIGTLNATNVFQDIKKDITNTFLPFVELLDLCLNKEIAKFVFLSSAGTVYGDSTSLSSEFDALNPTNIYGAQKVFFENLIRVKAIENEGFNFLILRISNPYGGLQNPLKNQGIIPVLINKALNDNEFLFWGEPTAIRDFIYISDFLRATFLAATQINNEILNVASGVGTTLREVMNVVEISTGKKLKVTYKRSISKVIMENQFNISKLKERTGFTPSITIKDGVEMIVKITTTRT